MLGSWVILVNRIYMNVGGTCSFLSIIFIFPSLHLLMQYKNTNFFVLLDFRMFFQILY
jgi:hypothetical protein